MNPPLRHNPVCLACHRPFDEDTARKAKVGGRPKKYCDDECRKLYHWLNAAEGRILSFASRATPERWATVRKRLWTALNSRAWNRGVPRVDGKIVAPWREREKEATAALKRRKAAAAKKRREEAAAYRARQRAK